jgi:hypothetical protein
MNLEFIAPAWEIYLGNYQLKKVSSIDVYSKRDRIMDMADIVLDPLGLDRSIFTEGMKGNIRLGYIEKGLSSVFEGQISMVSWQAETKFTLKGQAERLRTTPILQTFIDVTPQDIVKFGLNAAGVTNFKLSSVDLPRRHHFVSPNKNVIDLISLVSAGWGISWPAFFDPEPNGRFYFCPWDETGRDKNEILILEYGKNIFSLDPGRDGRGKLTTILLPMLRHSNLLKISDRRYWQKDITVRIESLHWHLSNKGRTEIEWIIV